VVAQDDSAAAIQRLDSRGGKVRRPEAFPVADELGPGRGQLVRTFAVHYGDIKRTSD
jgi:hypothetical protein